MLEIKDTAKVKEVSLMLRNNRQVGSLHVLDVDGSVQLASWFNIAGKLTGLASDKHGHDSVRWAAVDLATRIIDAAVAAQEAGAPIEVNLDGRQGQIDFIMNNEDPLGALAGLVVSAAYGQHRESVTLTTVGITLDEVRSGPEVTSGDDDEMVRETLERMLAAMSEMVNECPGDGETRH